METTQKNLPTYEQEAFCKGDYAEVIVQRLLEEKGFVVYRPVTHDKPHGFDMFAYKDKSYKFAVEIKTKSLCDKYPETGFEEYLHDRYVQLSEKLNLPVWILFCDEKRKEIYGNLLSKLDEEKTIEDMGEKGHYPKVIGHADGDNVTRYYHISSMKTFHTLTDEESQKLANFSTKKAPRQLTLCNGLYAETTS